MSTVILLLYVLSLVCALVAAAVGYAADQARSWARTNWLALAFALFVLTFLLARLVPNAA